MENSYNHEIKLIIKNTNEDFKEVFINNLEIY